MNINAIWENLQRTFADLLSSCFTPSDQQRTRIQKND
ncbi:unknown (plasmid) [Haloarcula marismortui ATCC 43049]|uniref:Uncharacterized protein n=1 Tax=Haloarcula marismortui (strain ATCC 43049 / DSM 3752 / JCM 8966 / VKM B-1809) TaxID=272569 RepID=Q5V7Q9_HALMA|nr:unknown [Haloarcula marismortui ATCC 43049]